jgi:hypothetical protein
MCYLCDFNGDDVSRATMEIIYATVVPKVIVAAV